MTFFRRSPSVAVLALVLSGPLFAQSDDLERCSNLESDAARLACYDAVMRERQSIVPDTPAPAEARTVTPPDATPPVSAVPPDAAPAAPAGRPGNVEAADPEPVAAEARSKDSAERKMSNEDRPKNYNAVVTAMYTRPLGQVVVTLDNGEQWSEQSASRAFHVEVGDTVTMKKSLLSTAYRLVSPSGRAYSMARVYSSENQ